MIIAVFTWRVFISSLLIGENVAQSQGPDESWEPVRPYSTKVHCTDWKLDKSAGFPSLHASAEQTDYDPAPVEQPKRCNQDSTVLSIYNFLKQICISPPKSRC